ncbi:hypothetical protein [Paraliomyxa miuraensis]|uniref:hypothetical protein n=1 Tax=Paraliomyxa miuraensis TaxID=376150 RepID=UPI002252F0B1|nr:hypothetical protein [Paraliomyxa miuraensis]MCX4247742.1 hypothetical protein [Paraliomyxa miuraensis]
MTAWLHALALLGRVAIGEPATLVVDGACEDAQALRERLATQVTNPTALGSVRLHAEHDGGPWRARLVFDVDGVAYERELAAESCEALYEASALVIGLTVQPADPPAANEEPEEPEVPAPDSSLDEPVGDELDRPEPSRALEPVSLDDPADVDDALEPAAASAVTPTAEREPPARALGGRVQVGGGVAVGVLHLVHPLLTAGGAVTGRRWAAGLDVLYLPPLTAEVAPRARAVVQLAAVSGRGCPVWRLANDRLALPVCAGLAVGRSWARGEGDGIVGRSGQETWVAGLVGPRAQLRARWGGELWLAAELLIPLRRLNFVIDELGPACCEHPLGAMVSMGGGWWGPRKRS